MSDTQQTTALPTADLDAAYAGSYFTILGAGGDLTEWIDGLTEMMQEAGIGTPRGWAVTTGGGVNYFAAKRALGDPIEKANEFDVNLVVLMVPLDGLDAGRLAPFKLRVGARWFDDVIDNMVA